MRRTKERTELTRPIVVVSPHLDDAALSCAHVLAAYPGCAVLTVLAGAPETYHDGYNSRWTNQDFAPDAIQIRRDEDERALATLGARPVWLDLLDADYTTFRGQQDYPVLVRRGIVESLRTLEPHTVFAPLGLIHRDHTLVSDACLDILPDASTDLILYMDLPYGLAYPRVATRRRRQIAKTARMTPVEVVPSTNLDKGALVQMYASQVAPLRETSSRAFDQMVTGEERYWRITSSLQRSS